MIAGAIGRVASKAIEAMPGMITAGQQASEDSQWGKQQRKQAQNSFDSESRQRDFYNNLRNTEDSEQVRKNEKDRSDSGESLLGRWNNESRDYNYHKGQVDAELRKSGAIKSEKQGSGKKAKNVDVYSSDFSQQQDAAYKKILGYNMTRDSGGKLIGSQSWDDVNKNDEAIMAGKAQQKREQQQKQYAYGVNGSASYMNRWM